MSYRILAWDGAKVLELYERTDRDAALKLYRRVTQPACFVEGAIVVYLNARGKRHEPAFRAATKRIASPTTPPRELAPEVCADIDEAIVAELFEAPASPEPEAPVKIARKTKLVRKPADAAPVTCGAHGCDNPRAKVRADSLPETADFCAGDRLNARNRARDAGCTLGELAEMMRAGTWVASRGVARVPKTTKTRAPTKASKRKAASHLADVLVRVKRDRAVVDELGGIDAAERFVDIVRHAGGPDAVFAFFDEVGA